MSEESIVLKSGSDFLYPVVKIENIVDLNDADIAEMGAYTGASGQVLTANGSGRCSWQSLPVGVSYTTTAPTAANTDGTLHFVVLAAEPATYYNGYYYIITGA